MSAGIAEAKSYADEKLAAGASPMPEAVKSAIVKCFENVAWENDSAASSVRELKAALGIDVVESILLEAQSLELKQGIQH